MDHSAILTSAQQYLDWSTSIDTTEYSTLVRNWISTKNMVELDRHFGKRISFGTAGLRARMAPGYACMNGLVVLQTSQGLCMAAEAALGSSAKTRGIVIGFDARYNSQDFALITAQVFLSRGWVVRLFKDEVCTPMVPFGVLLKSAAVGVVVTASHNPKDDNGFKVYWSNGAQIVPPEDARIASAIMDNLQPWDSLPSPVLQPLVATNLLSDPTDEVTREYYAAAKQYCYHEASNKSAGIRIAYTAMHGVGRDWIVKAFDCFGLPQFVPVVEQNEPDPEFSTVAFPNPEEGKGALALAIKTANENNCTVVLANDPDADRLAVAEKNGDDWRIFTGNDIAVLFSNWVWVNYRKSHPDVDPSTCLMLASTVSSKYLQSMAKTEGFVFADTLTGFKWLGSVGIQMEKELGLELLFAYEVEIGFLVGNMSYDKDGVRTAAVMAEMAEELRKQGKTLAQELDFLRSKYGYFEMTNSYYFSDSNATLEAIFSRLRDEKEDFSDIGGYKVASVRDASTGRDSAQSDGVCKLPLVGAGNHMITYRFENGAVATIRNSGTEPKVKYYVECVDYQDEEAARKLLLDMTEAFVRVCIRPEVHNMNGPPS